MIGKGNKITIAEKTGRQRGGWGLYGRASQLFHTTPPTQFMQSPNDLPSIPHAVSHNPATQFYHPHEFKIDYNKISFIDNAIETNWRISQSQCFRQWQIAFRKILEISKVIFSKGVSRYYFTQRREGIQTIRTSTCRKSIPRKSWESSMCPALGQ